MNIFGIILDGTSLWLLAVAGACLAWFVPHRLSISRERQNSFRVASVRFRSGILNALSGLYPIPNEWPREHLAILQVLQKRFSAMQVAVREFRSHVPLLKRWFFDRAWRLYRLGKDGREIDGQYYWQYVPHSGEGIEHGRHYKHDNTRTYKDDFKKNIDRLLSYAKET